MLYFSGTNITMGCSKTEDLCCFVDSCSNFLLPYCLFYRFYTVLRATGSVGRCCISLIFQWQENVL